MANQEISRKQAAHFIDEVLKFVCLLEEGKVNVTKTDVHQVRQATYEIGNRLRTIAAEHGLIPPRPCDGDAHSNAHIDNCGTCMGYSWGLTGEKVKVK